MQFTSVAIILESEAIGILANYTSKCFIKLIPGCRGVGPITLKAPLCSQKTELETEKKKRRKEREKERRKLQETGRSDEK